MESDGKIISGENVKSSRDGKDIEFNGDIRVNFIKIEGEGKLSIDDDSYSIDAAEDCSISIDGKEYLLWKDGKMTYDDSDGDLFLNKDSIMVKEQRTIMAGEDGCKITKEDTMIGDFTVLLDDKTIMIADDGFLEINDNTITYMYNGIILSKASSLSGENVDMDNFDVIGYNFQDDKMSPFQRLYETLKNTHEGTHSKFFGNYMDAAMFDDNGNIDIGEYARIQEIAYYNQMREGLLNYETISGDLGISFDLLSLSPVVYYHADSVSIAGTQVLPEATYMATANRYNAMGVIEIKGGNTFYLSYDLSDGEGVFNQEYNQGSVKAGLTKEIGRNGNNVFFHISHKQENDDLRAAIGLNFPLGAR
jgi:hypothetical protein